MHLNCESTTEIHHQLWICIFLPIAFGADLDHHLFGEDSLRGGKEYESWPEFLQHSSSSVPAHALDLHGFAIGVTCHFARKKLRLH
jgi:hypothetical protein